MKFLRHLIISDIEGVDPLWHVQLVVLMALLLQMLLPDRLVYGPPGSKYVVPLLEIFLLIGLSVSTPKTNIFESRLRRFFSVSLIALITIFNTASLVLLVQHLLSGKTANGLELILSSIPIYITNTVIFALWYWEIDRGGPGLREIAEKGKYDFLFPQMSTPHLSSPKWKPTFLDYLYVSSTNAMAFSPTDTLPFTIRAKMLMLIQAGVSLITIALVAARAVNILS